MQVAPGTGEGLKGSVGIGEIRVAREAARLHGGCGRTGPFPGSAHRDGHSGPRAILCLGRDRTGRGWGAGAEKAARVRIGKGFHAIGVWRVDGDD